MSLIDGGRVDEQEARCKAIFPECYDVARQLPKIDWQKPPPVVVHVASTAADVDAAAGVMAVCKALGIEATMATSDPPRISARQWRVHVARMTVAIFVVTPHLVRLLETGSLTNMYFYMLTALRRGMRIVPLCIGVDPVDLRKHPSLRALAAVGGYFGGDIHYGHKGVDEALNAVRYSLPWMKRGWGKM